MDFQAAALIEALDQYVTNTSEYIENHDDPDPDTIAKLDAAIKLLDELNIAYFTCL